MNLQWFTSPEWANVVKALLHTLWQGALIAGLLGLALRRMDSPVARYRSSLVALAGVALAGLVTWAVLNRPMTAPTSHAAAPATAAVDEPVVQSDMAPLVVHFPPSQPKAVAGLGWTAWLALVWLAGATVMIGRAGFQVAGAERLRRASQPLADVRIAELLAEARKAVGLARRVRLAVTDRLTSPAVVGVLVPTLILPLSLTSTLSPEQIRFILLHELAHIRRGDYFANLFQLFAEALLFFNPAVWWLSHQMRIEREACCDALAIELSGAPADYARTLVHVAENVLNPSPQAAPAFGDKREPSSLADRVQRLLVPGYRPRLRLTWRAMLGALCVGGTLLTLSAIGTRVTVAAILSPQQRIDRIEKKMTELGEQPELVETSDWDKMPRVEVNGVIRTADGSPVPKWVQVNINSTINHSSYGTSAMARNGLFTNSIRQGSITLSTEVTNYAPAVAGPLDGRYTNLFFYVVMTLEPGFDVPLQIRDADSGKLLPGASVNTMFWINNNGFQTHTWKSGADGALMLTHCADLPMDVTVNVPGYEIFKKRIDHLSAGQPVTIALRPGKTVAGTVLDKATGQPLAGAEFHLLYQAGGEGAGNYGWDNPLFMLGQSDANGAFNLNQLRDGVRYYLGVSAPGHESVILKNVTGDTNNLMVRLGPELIVHGHVNGNLGLLPQTGQNRVLDLSTSEVYGNYTYNNSTLVLVHVTDGVATFLFTNRTAGTVTLSGQNGYREDRDVVAPVDDWVVNLKEPEKTETKEGPKREVVFRFQHPSGVPPRGTVQVEIPDNLDINHLTSHYQSMEFTNGEVHAQIAIGGRTSVEPQHMIGYWFNRAGLNGNLLSMLVTNGNGPMVINIPLIPAGAIYAKARNADGTPAGGIFFGVTELKRAPGRDQNSLEGANGGDGFSDNAPRQWVSGPLPLGGKYQIQAWRGNTFCVSEPVKLTEANPDAEVELQFAPGKKFMGQVLDADGKPLRDAELKPLFTLAGDHSFGLTSLYSNERGWFELSDATPDLGEYSVEEDAPGMMAERVALDFKSQPQTIRLKRGHTLAGRVVEAGTGQPIPGAEVRALDYSSNQRPMVTTQTDADGHFEFTTLADMKYTLYTADGEMKSDSKFRADGNTNVELRIKLYGWSKVKAKTAAAENTGEARASDGVEADTNKAQIFMRIHFYQTATGELEKIGADWKFTEAGNGHEVYRAVPAGEFKTVQDRLAAKAMPKVSPPRVVTLDGEPAQIRFSNEGFSCGPVIDGETINLAVEGANLPGPSWQETTNAFNFKVPVANHGGLLLRMDNLGGFAGSNLVALVSFDIITSDSVRFQQRLQRMIKPAPEDGAYTAGHQKIITQLQAIRLARFGPFDGETLSNVVLRLSEAVEQQNTNHDKIRFTIVAPEPLIDPTTGLPTQPNPAMDAGTVPVHLKTSLENLTVADILDEVIKAAGPAVKYSIADDGVRFSRRNPGVDAGEMKVMRLEPDGSVREDKAMQAAVDAGANMMMSFKVDGSLPENQLKQALTDAGVAMPPTVTMYNSEGGVLLVRGTAEQLVLATRAVLKLNGASAGQINAVNRDYIKGASLMVPADVRTNMLFTRTFKVDVRRFIAGLKNMGVEVREGTNSSREISAAVRDCFSRLGMDLESPPGKSVFFNDKNGMLFVKASGPDLDVVDKVIQTINQMAPQVHIKARFLQVPNGTITGFGQAFNITNSIAGQFTGILNATNTQALLRSLASRQDSVTLAEPEATTTSGRQCQMRATEVVTVLTNFVFQENTSTNANAPSAIVPETMQYETGPMLDVVPHVLADGYTINLAVTPTLNEFLGYDQGPNVPNVTGTNNTVQLPAFPPRFSTRQMTATLNIRDGQTVVMGGMPETRYSTHKVPVLGSVPLMGRWFNSTSSSTNEVLVLVSVDIVDPAGNRVHSDEELSHFQSLPDKAFRGNGGSKEF